MSTATLTLTCSRCSRVTIDPHKAQWRFDDPPLVVQGVALGLCWYCRTGEAPPAEGEKSCDGSCDGNYRPKKGVYYEARWGDSWSRSDVGERHACWDEGCCEAWADEQDDECHHCGHSIDIEVVKYVDGKQVRS